jgi:hypothetical protein
MAFGLIAAGATLISGGLGIAAGKKKRKARRARRQISKIKNFQAKRQFINSFITAQSNTLAAGAVSGADLSSSGVQGQLASQETQARVGIIETNRMEQLEAQAGRAEDKASRLAGAASFLNSSINAAGFLKDAGMFDRRDDDGQVVT